MQIHLRHPRHHSSRTQHSKAAAARDQEAHAPRRQPDVLHHARRPNDDSRALLPATQQQAASVPESTLRRGQLIEPEVSNAVTHDPLRLGRLWRAVAAGDVQSHPRPDHAQARASREDQGSPRVRYKASPGSTCKHSQRSQCMYQNSAEVSKILMLTQKVLAYGQSEYVRQFGMHVEQSPLKIQARVLEPPTLRYGQGSRQQTIVSSSISI